MTRDSQTFARMVIEALGDWIASLGAFAWVAMGLLLFAGLAVCLWSLSFVYGGRSRRKRRGWLPDDPPKD